MAGLLGNGFDDPQSAAIMALSAGLVNGNFGAGLLGANAAYREASNDKVKRGLLEADMAERLSHAEERKAKLAMAQRQQDTIARIFGNGAPSQPAAPGQLGSGSFGAVGAPMGQPDIPAPQQGGRLSRMSADDLALLKLNGLDISEAWKAANIPTQIRSNSFSFLPGQQPRYMPDPTKGMDFKDGRISPIPGYTDFVAGQAFAQELPKTVLGAAGQVSLRPNSDGTQSPVVSLNENPVLQGLMSQYFGGSGTLGAPRSAPATPPMAGGARPTIAPDVQKGRDAESIRMIESELQNPNLPPDQRAGLQREVQRLTASQSQPGFPTPTMKISPQGQGYGKTTAQQADEKSREVYGEAVAKDMAETRKSILGAGFAAPGNIAKYEQLGRLLADVDGGVLTGTGTNIASAANSFGLKIDKNLPNKEAAAALANQIALEMRNPAGGAGMPGALSDKDREFLVGMTPNAGQTAQGRKMLIESYIALQRRNQQVATFARNYEQKYGRLDNGFFEQMQAWSSANQMFGGK
jgi:hypothetical protein